MMSQTPMSPTDQHERRIAVIGGGIIGICCGLCLQRDGRQVTIFEPDGPGEGCSSGNAGQFVTGYCVPVSLPGIVKQVPSMLMDPLSPLTIRWRYLPRLTPWLLRFMAAGTVSRVDAIADALYALNKNALIDFRPLLKQAGAENLVVTNGRMDLYRSKKKFNLAQIKFDLLIRHGVQVEMLDTQRIRELEPALADRYDYGALYPETAHTTDPLRLCQLLAEDFVRNGGRILREKVCDVQVDSSGAATVQTDGARHRVSHVVLAAGAFSRPLASKLGSRVPLDAERGYHVMLPNARIELSHTVVDGDMYFGLTPMQSGLRLAGTVELASVNAAPNFTRADNLLKAAKETFPQLNDEGSEQWMGCRPSLPDSLPVIGRSPVHRSVIFAFGHGHLGLTGAATTGKIIADLIAERPPEIDITPFRAERF